MAPEPYGYRKSLRTEAADERALGRRGKSIFEDMQY